MLPLLHKVPVPLTDNNGRNPAKRFLRGRVGFVHSWVLSETEVSAMEDGVERLTKVPAVVFVKFPDAKWTLPGLTEPGLYPVTSRKGSWWLDKGRKHPVLKITRRQLPLAPAFAMTAHAAQGQKQPAAIVDLQIGRGTNATASDVASTRVPSREDLLIYRPFARDLYTQGGPEWPQLLLKTLRGEQVDRAAIEAKHTPSRVFSGCGFMHFMEDCALSQWNRKDGRHFCKQCVAHKTNAGVPFKCMEGCGHWKFAAALSPEELRKTLHRVCIDCADKTS